MIQEATKDVVCDTSLLCFSTLERVGLHMNTINNIQSFRLGWRRLKKEATKALQGISPFSMLHLLTFLSVAERIALSHHYHRSKRGSREKDNTKLPSGNGFPASAESPACGGCLECRLHSQFRGSRSPAQFYTPVPSS